MKYPFLIAALLFLQPGKSQPTVCGSMHAFSRAIALDPALDMLELSKICPALRIDLRYAGTDNFVGRRMYPKGTKHTFLRREPAQALCRIQEALAAKGLGLKIWDAYRPYTVTKAFWDLIGDERYVANPAKGSGHNRGISVDLTLIRSDTGEELPMGTGFDHFGDSAHHDFTTLPTSILENRRLLRTIMEQHGFRMYQEEWWHYSWPGPERFALLDLPFHRLRRRN